MISDVMMAPYHGCRLHLQNLPSPPKSHKLKSPYDGRPGYMTIGSGVLLSSRPSAARSWWDCMGPARGMLLSTDHCSPQVVFGSTSPWYESIGKLLESTSSCVSNLITGRVFCRPIAANVITLRIQMKKENSHCVVCLEIVGCQ